MFIQNLVTISQNSVIFSQNLLVKLDLNQFACSCQNLFYVKSDLVKKNKFFLQSLQHLLQN